MTDRVELGYVARAHGVRGELRVHLHNEASDALFRVDVVYLGADAYTVRGARDGSKGAVLLAVDEVRDRNAADALRGSTVSVDRDVVVDDGDVLITDLVGCDAVLPDGTPYGVVHRIEAGPQDRLVIRDGDVERQVPLVDELVIDVDLEARRVVVDPPEGLPEERVR